MVEDQMAKTDKLRKLREARMNELKNLKTDGEWAITKLLNNNPNVIGTSDNHVFNKAFTKALLRRVARKDSTRNGNSWILKVTEKKCEAKWVASKKYKGTGNLGDTIDLGTSLKGTGYPPGTSESIDALKRLSKYINRCGKQ